MPRLADVLAVLDGMYDPSRAEQWDAVGLVCGDPEAEIGRVMFAVDPVMAVAEEAVAWEADLLVTHHPLFLRPVHGVAASTPKGRVVHTLIRHGIALHVAHTNADSADPGVSDALAAAIGLTDLRPLAPQPFDQTDKLVVFVPEPDTDRLIDVLADAGAGRIGAYDRCAWMASGVGTFRAGEGTNPVIGSVGAVEQVHETRVEMVMPRNRRHAVLSALVAAHPYEEPAYDVYELASLPASSGIGRVGTLPEPEPLATFAHRVARALPATAGGVRVGGDLDASVQTVAVCGGAGDSLFDAVRAASVDAYVTADLRHHPASEAREAGAPALVDVAHWASEWPWLSHVAERLAAELGRSGTTVETRVSRTQTDPWTLRVGSLEEGSSAER
ncbi:MAG TPA: Nif3-like dinuclear metal center hexameric protein [Jiangellales bacterium]|nr:Nif3-like dinuclear metal center hexameric protein [Jiangellales bacterium]